MRITADQSRVILKKFVEENFPLTKGSADLDDLLRQKLTFEELWAITRTLCREHSRDFPSAYFKQAGGALYALAEIEITKYVSRNQKK